MNENTQIESRAYKDCSIEPKSMLTQFVELDKDEIYNLIEFIECEFIDILRNDTDIDNIDYLVSMMNALQKLRVAYKSIKSYEVHK